MTTTRLTWFATMRSHVPVGTYRFWLGEGNRTYGGQTYNGVMGPNGAAMAIGQMTAGTSVGLERLTIQIAGTTATAKQFMQNGYGPMETTVEWASSPDAGKSFVSTNRSYKGRISNGDYDFNTNIFSSEIESQAGLQDYSLPQQWDHASQQQRHPGDLGFEYTDDLASGIDIKWH